MTLLRQDGFHESATAFLLSAVDGHAHLRRYEPQEAGRPTEGEELRRAQDDAAAPPPVVDLDLPYALDRIGFLPSM